jgi:hypothetical protein
MLAAGQARLVLDGRGGSTSLRTTKTRSLENLILQHTLL